MTDSAPVIVRDRQEAIDRLARYLAKRNGFADHALSFAVAALSYEPAAAAILDDLAAERKK